MNLGSAYQATNQIEKNIDALEHFVKVTKKPDEKTFAENMIAELKEVLRTQVKDDSKTDYLKSVLAGGRDRWNADRQPIKVFIADGSAVPKYKPEFTQFMKDAFAAWQAASGGHLKFEFVPTESESVIDVRWAASPQELGNSAEAGKCTRILDGTGKGIKRAHIAIGLFSKDLSTEDVRAIILHEVGHACGLDGHSFDPADVMYISDGAAVVPSELSARDKETLRRFYSEDIGESWLSLMNRANTLTQKQEFKEAAACFEEALKMADDPMVKSNYAALHFNWASNAAQKGNIATADEHFKAALKMQKAKPDANYPLVVQTYAKFLRWQKRDAEAVAVEKLK